MKYADALALLNARGNELQGIHLGLHRIREVMRALGDPQDRLAVLHVAGTNGKGSVSAMAESILREAGHRTGLYTSPHLVRIEERIRVDGRAIAPRRLASCIERVAAVEAALLAEGRLDHAMTYFEILTASSFVHFASKDVDFAVIEVGLGGLLDATNIVHPRACVITGISLDHTELLGDTIRKIAREKAGIIKAGAPVISGCASAASRSVVRGRAARVGSPVFEIGRDCVLAITGEAEGRVRMDLETPRGRYRGLRLALAGRHQARNAAMAVAAVEAVLGARPAVRHVRTGLGTIRWPGRMQMVRARRRTLLEGAHNPEGARLLRQHLDHTGETEIHLVFGAMSDKDIRSMGRLLFPRASSIHLTPIANPRSAAPEEIARMHRRHRDRMRLHRDAREALRAAWESATPDGIVVVTGSLYLVGEVLPLMPRAAG